MIRREIDLKEQEDYFKKVDSSCLADISLLQQEKQSLTLKNERLERLEKTCLDHYRIHNKQNGINNELYVIFQLYYLKNDLTFYFVSFLQLNVRNIDTYPFFSKSDLTSGVT